MHKLQQALTPPEPAKWPAFLGAGFLSGLTWALLIQFIDSHSAADTVSALASGSLWLTALFLGLITLALSFLTRSLFVGNLVVGFAGVLLAFVNYYKVSITFTPLSISDFSLIGQMGNIAAMSSDSLHLRPAGICGILLAILWLAAAWLFSRPLRLPKKHSLPAGLATVLLFALVFWIGANPLVFSPLGVDSEASMTQSAINKEAGVVLGLWRSLYRQQTYTAPTDFSQEALDDLLQRVEGSASSSSGQSSSAASSSSSQQPDSSVPGDTSTPPESPSPGDTSTPPEPPSPGDTSTPPETSSPGDTSTPPEPSSPGDTPALPETPAPDYSGPEEKKPNILLILSESFFDVTTLEGVTYATDPLPEFHALQKEGVSGKFYTRTLGYGTCSIELEVLTGINTTLLNNEDLSSMDPVVFSRLPSVPSLLKENGYSTFFLHMFNDGIYNRTSLFKYLSFDKMYFSGDFAQFYEPAAQAAVYWDFMRPHISGAFYSDDLMSDLLISLYEKQKTESDSPVFLYGVSMENHNPHTSKYSSDELKVSPQSSLTGEAATSLLNVSQGASNASAALKKLVDYFRTVDEPTVIVFFGDHRPGLGLTDGGSVYSALGMVSDKVWTWSLEDFAELYSTNYLIWANDPDYLPGNPGSTKDTSLNFLGVQLLDLAAVEKPLHWRTLSALSLTRSIDTYAYHRSTSGVLSASAPTEGDEGQLLNLLAGLLREALYGTASSG